MTGKDDLSSEARSLIRAARLAEDPTAEDRARMRRGLALRLGVSAGLIAGASAGLAEGATAGGAAGAGGLGGATSGAGGVSVSVAGAGVTGVSAAVTKLGLTKLLVVAASVSLGGAGVGYLAGRPGVPSPRPVRPAPAAPVLPPAPPVERLRAPPAPEAVSAPVVVPVIAPVEAPPPAARVLARVERGPRRKVATPVVEAAAAPAVSVSVLAEETGYLATARGELNAGRAVRALALLEDYPRRFPHGMLREEHAATQVLVLSELDRSVEACAHARRFLERWPRSPLAEKVRAACRAP
jgi:hypothetical protein